MSEPRLSGAVRAGGADWAPSEDGGRDSTRERLGASLRGCSALDGRLLVIGASELPRSDDPGTFDPSAGWVWTPRDPAPRPAASWCHGTGSCETDAHRQPWPATHATGRTASTGARSRAHSIGFSSIVRLRGCARGLDGIDSAGASRRWLSGRGGASNRGGVDRAPSSRGRHPRARPGRTLIDRGRRDGAISRDVD